MKLGFIGIGRIASAVVKGLCTSNIENTTINLSPRNDSNSNYLAKIYSSVNRLENNQLVLDNSDIIFISVPPNNSKEILNNLKFKETHTIISFIPFLILKLIQKIRIMNTKIIIPENTLDEVSFYCISVLNFNLCPLIYNYQYPMESQNRKNQLFLL